MGLRGLIGFIGFGVCGVSGVVCRAYGVLQGFSRV